mmetsp:Transcript_23091/g.33820  ORF Transcript_23091/g.33820 Transcript_23091/m.33820 type:complete len:873 (+) Transcript_23091:97-2715(+)
MLTLTCILLLISAARASASASFKVDSSFRNLGDTLQISYVNYFAASNEDWFYLVPKSYGGTLRDYWRQDVDASWDAEGYTWSYVDHYNVDVGSVLLTLNPQYLQNGEYNLYYLAIDGFDLHISPSITIVIGDNCYDWIDKRSGVTSGKTTNRCDAAYGRFRFSLNRLEKTPCISTDDCADKCCFHFHYVEVVRTHISKDGVFGELYVDGIEQVKTLENIDHVIPAGTYSGTFRRYNKRGYVTPFVLGVPIKDPWILFHTGNYQIDSKGCFLVGLTHSIVSSKPKAVVNSRKAMKKLMSVLDYSQLELSGEITQTPKQDLFYVDFNMCNIEPFIMNDYSGLTVHPLVITVTSTSEFDEAKKRFLTQHTPLGEFISNEEDYNVTTKYIEFLVEHPYDRFYSFVNVTYIRIEIQMRIRNVFSTRAITVFPSFEGYSMDPNCDYCSTLYLQIAIHGPLDNTEWDLIKSSITETPLCLNQTQSTCTNISAETCTTCRDNTTCTEDFTCDTPDTGNYSSSAIYLYLEAKYSSNWDGANLFMKSPEGDIVLSMAPSNATKNPFQTNVFPTVSGMYEFGTYFPEGEPEFIDACTIYWIVSYNSRSNTSSFYGSINSSVLLHYNADKEVWSFERDSNILSEEDLLDYCVPTHFPSGQPSGLPSSSPTSPSMSPSSHPSLNPTTLPTSIPSFLPTAPTFSPTTFWDSNILSAPEDMVLFSVVTPRRATGGEMCATPINFFKLRIDNGALFPTSGYLSGVVSIKHIKGGFRRADMSLRLALYRTSNSTIVFSTTNNLLEGSSFHKITGDPYADDHKHWAVGKADYKLLIRLPYYGLVDDGGNQFHFPIASDYTLEIDLKVLGRSAGESDIVHSCVRITGVSLF